MTNPQTSPPPPAPAYPATSAGKRRLHIECQPVGISRQGVIPIGWGIVDGLQEKDVNLNEVFELGSSVMNKNDDVFDKDSVVSLNQKFIEHNNGRLSDQSLIEALALERWNRRDVIIPYEKLEGPVFPLDLLVTSSESIDEDGNCYVGNDKRWDDTVGQYPIDEVPDLMSSTYTISNKERTEMSMEEFLKNIKRHNRRNRKELNALVNYGTDFVGRSGEL